MLCLRYLERKNELRIAFADIRKVLDKREAVHKIMHFILWLSINIAVNDKDCSLQILRLREKHSAVNIEIVATKMVLHYNFTNFFKYHFI